MKFDITFIIKRYFMCLTDVNNKKSPIDYMVFIFLPAIIAIISFYLDIKLSKDFYSLSISYIGIFIALLLNIQVGVFAVFQNKKEVFIKNLDDEVALKGRDIRNIIIIELNDIISYLIVIGTFLLFFSILSFIYFDNIQCKLISDINFEAIFSSVFLAINLHFIITFFMVIKRAHIIFLKEYQSGL